LDEGFIFISSFNKINYNASQFVKILLARKFEFENNFDFENKINQNSIDENESDVSNNIESFLFNSSDEYFKEKENPKINDFIK